jgi:hypothetical protein
LFEELINLLLQQDISEDFLVRKGVAVAFLKKGNHITRYPISFVPFVDFSEDRKRESDREEEEEDDYKLEEQEDTGEEEEEDERPRATKKRTQPTTVLAFSPFLFLLRFPSAYPSHTAQEKGRSSGVGAEESEDRVQAQQAQARRVGRSRQASP